MAIKTHKVTLSLDNPRVIQSGINVQSFDKQSIQISIELTKNGEVFQVPNDATIRVSLLKLARQEQKIIVDVPNNNRESIDWIVPDYLDGYQGAVRVGVYLVSGTENVDLGYFTILSNVSDIDKMADEFTDNVFQGWEQIEADLNELNLTIAQTKLDLADDLAQIDSTIANINAKNTQVNTLHSDFTTDVATKQSDVTSKYNAFDSSVTQANQTIDEILALQPQFQSVLDETTGKDVISAPEVILARGGAQTLGERLDSERAEVSAQLAQIESKMYSKSTSEIRPLVSFYLDDGYSTDYTVAFQKTKDLGVPITICLHNDSYLALKTDEATQRRNELLDAGWEIHGHTVKDQTLPDLSYEEQYETMRDNKEYLEDLIGEPIEGFVYPRGQTNPDTLRAARELFGNGMGSEPGINDSPIDNYYVKRYLTDSGLSHLKADVDKIKADGEGWIVIYAHTNQWGINPTFRDNFFEMIDYVVNKGIETVSVKYAMKVYGNTLDIGDIKYSPDYFKVGSDGRINSSSIPYLKGDNNPLINDADGTDFVSGRITIDRYTSGLRSNIPFDNGVGSLFTNRLEEEHGLIGSRANQRFEGVNGTIVERNWNTAHGWTDWVTHGLLNSVKIKPITASSPLDDFKSGKVSVNEFLSGEAPDFPKGGIGTLITSRIGYNSVTHFQMFYPYNRADLMYRRTWNGSSWASWSEFGAVVKFSETHNFGEIEANNQKTYTFPANGLSGFDVLSVSFVSGIASGISYISYVQDANNYVLRLFNHTGSTINVGTRIFMVNINKD